MWKLWIIFILLSFCDIAYSGTNGVSWFRGTFGKLTWGEMVEVSDSPREICRRVKVHIDYREDGKYILKGEMETWDDGYGDCDDFANCCFLSSKSCDGNGCKCSLSISSNNSRLE